MERKRERNQFAVQPLARPLTGFDFLERASDKLHQRERERKRAREKEREGEEEREREMKAARWRERGGGKGWRGVGERKK